MVPLTELAIWWTSGADCRQIGEEALEGPPFTIWPDYLRIELRSRFGRNGRGRLWVPRELDHVDSIPWPDTPLAQQISDASMAGIVLYRLDLPFLHEMPGFVTDLQLQLIH